MSTVTVSPAFEVILPPEIRERLGIRPGQRLDVFAYDGRIEMVPVRPPREMRGFLAGMDATIELDPDRM